jgi:CBS domain containing-hemolysin-like protein
MKLVYILLALGFIKCVALYKIYHSVPNTELKRRARSGDRRAAKLYKAAAYQPSLDVLLWLFGTACAAGLFIWSARTSWWLASAVIAGSGWLLIWSKFSISGWAGGAAAFAAPYYAGLLSFINPVLGRIARLLPPGRRVHVHTGLYEKKDLLELLDKQNKQMDNRIAEADLRIAGGAISFGDKTVSSVMTPRRQMKFVGADETVGPMLMDELHKTGHSRFPVTKDSTKSASPQIVATLYLKDIIGYQGGGKVKDHARKDVYYISEDANLRQALDEFLKTHHHLLIVVNNFEEIAGGLSIEDVFEQIIGKPINDEFDSYDSLRAVAAKDAEAERKNHNETPVAPEAE